MDLRRFEDNWIGALAQFERRRDEFAQQFVKPLAEDMMMALLSGLQSGQVATMDQIDPAIITNAVDKLTKGG